jgi:hypothetical protein
MPSKLEARCKHPGNIFPKDEAASLRRDCIVGWVVDVQCGKCGQTGIAPIACSKTEWDGVPDVSNEELVKLYGPFTEIWREREAELMNQGKWRHILSIQSFDSEDEEDGTILTATVGHHLVNTETVFESAKPMPDNLRIDDFWFDDYLKAP